MLHRKPTKPIITKPSVPDEASHGANILLVGGLPNGWVIPIALPTVVTVTVAVETDDPLSVIELGDTEQVD